jgi:endothelin-converting enzyme/putative endopeptidase
MKRLILSAMLAATLSGAAQSTSLQSVELKDMNRKTDPCNDFYDFSNGAWRAANPIPASMDRWSRRWQAGEQNKDQLRIILDEVSAKPGQPKGSVGQLTGDFYAACMDVKAVDAAGFAPVKPYFAKIDAIGNAAGLQRAIAELHLIGVSSPFAYNGNQDNHAPQNVIADVGASGLGLPDRDYYLKPEKRFVDARAVYLLHVEKMLALTGDENAKSDASTVMTFETALAKASLDNVALRDPAATDHKMSQAQLQALTPHFDWAGFSVVAGVRPADLNVDQPEFMKEFDRQLAQTSLSDWKAYLKWQLLNSVAMLLSQPFEDEQFDFNQRKLAGVGELKPRGTRCAEMTDQLLGEALGQEYVKRYFPPEAKARATAMVGNILAAMHDTISDVDWMSPETKKKALEKLSTFNVKVGYPDKWKDYSSVAISRGDYFADAIAGFRFAVQDDAGTIGKPVNRQRWGMTPPTSNAYYNPQMNEIVFPAGILQPPAFSANYVDAVNYGAIGVVIGHEISHGFDDQGAQYDASGKLSNWWLPEDKKKFDAKTACVVRQFDGYTIDDGEIHINGKLTLGESIGDLGGVKLAYLAFQKAQKTNPAAVIDGMTPDQQFFVAWGQFRGDAVRLETQKLMVQGDPHPYAKYRVIGPLSNFAPFAKAYGCKAGTTMVRSEADRCVVW